MSALYRRLHGSYPETLVLYRTRPAGLPKPVQLPTRRVRYSCLKEAAGEEAFMQIQWCFGSERESGNRYWGESERGPDWFDCSLRAKARSPELGMGQLGRTTAAGDGKHRGSEMAIGVSCSGSDQKRWRTELELGSRKSLDDHHGAATLGTEPKRARFLDSRCLLFYLRLRYRAE